MSRVIFSIGLLYVFAISLSSLATADGNRKSLADKHAPAGIMGDHQHQRGEWMVEYRYMNMYMEDNLIGKTKVSDTAAIGALGTNNGATPTQMTMEMHMMHVMYGASGSVTLYTMLMLPSLTMDHIRGPANPAPSGPGSPFTTHNSGFGDLAFGALLSLYSDECSDLILNFGGSAPTGDIFRTTTVPTEGILVQPLPFPMRLGSGTFNARPGITYKKFCDRWSWGIQFQTDLPVGRNYRGYSVGDEFRYNSWTSALLTDNWSVSLRGEHLWRSAFDGIDSATPDPVISTNVEAFRGGYWYNLGIGTQFIKSGHYLNFEIVPTLHQDLDGIQLETDYAIIGSWSKSW